MALVAINFGRRVDGLRSALTVLALVALFFAGGVPPQQPGAAQPDSDIAATTA